MTQSETKIIFLKHSDVWRQLASDDITILHSKFTRLSWEIWKIEKFEIVQEIIEKMDDYKHRTSNEKFDWLTKKH